MANAQPKPAVVVAAWNRPRSLQRLLGCLTAGTFPPDTPLHISLDHFEYDDVRRLAESYEWPFGPKFVEIHPSRLGLRQHMLHCLGLTERYGSILLLEDDLAVAPHAYEYAQAALGFFADDPQVAGISLYQYAVAESCHQPFLPWQDEWDNWFLQLPSSWGAAFSAAQVQGFIAWLSVNAAALPPLPPYIAQWSAQSWKKLFAAYLISQDKYFAYPRFSLTTNFEDYGAHANSRGLFQVPLQMGRRQWRFGALAESTAVYDAFFEPLPRQLSKLCPALNGYTFAVDLFGQKSKPFLGAPWLLTRRRGGEAALAFGDTALPIELNLQLQTPGTAIRLVPSNAVLEEMDPLKTEFGYYNGVAQTPLLHLPEQRMPSVSVIVAPESPCLQDEQLMERLLAADYPGMEILAVTSPGKMPLPVWKSYRAGLLAVIASEGSAMDGLRQAVAACPGNLVLILDGPEVGVVSRLEEICRIFRQFPGLDWLSCLPCGPGNAPISQLMALYRWDSERFREADDQAIRTYLPAAMQVFRRSLWIKANADAPTLPAMFKRMGGVVLPQVTEMVVGDGVMPKPLVQDSCWGTGPVNRSRRHYHRHMPLLWKLHRRRSDYRPVLRFDATHRTWFESEY